MCGIAGLFLPKPDLPHEDLSVLARIMADTLRHRGPDDGGVWADEQAGIALSHRRLSIIDLSPAGAQPMRSGSGRYVISYNGEIYGHRALRTELQALGHTFRGQSDTEVIAEGLEAWGLDEMLDRMIGMFSMAIWDRQDRCLTLVRDRMGIKPLYWGWVGGGFVFASELKALTRLPGWQGGLNHDSLADFIRLAYIPAPATIYDGIFKLAPGHVLQIRPGQEPQIRPFWDMRGEWAAPRSALSDQDAIRQLTALLHDAVAKRMVADVPVGAFLSGGIDSSLVVALMQQVGGDARTFSIGFAERDYDESGPARAIAQHLGTRHTDVIIGPDDGARAITMMPGCFDEPFADASQIPTYLVSALARQQVTVALSGDGGDELFAGYSRYDLGRRFSGARLSGRAIRWGIGALSQDGWDRLNHLIPRRHRPRHLGHRLYKLRHLLGQGGADRRYLALLSQWPEPEQVVRQGRVSAFVLDDPGLAVQVPDFASRMQLADLLTYLPEDILAKVDRVSMAVSLEVRVPILDHRVVRFAAGLTPDQRVRHGKGKWALRQVLSHYVPAHLTDRPKMGFGVPIDHWLRGPLREWAQDLLSADRLRKDGLFHPEPVTRAWQQHLSGRGNLQHSLWTILMANAWLDHRSGPATTDVV